MRRSVKEVSPWGLIQGSLDSYRPEQLATLLRDYLTPRVPVGVRTLPESLRAELRRGVEAILDEHLGPWYHQGGVQLGRERVDGYCWCHGFFNHRPVPDVGVEHNVQLMLKALERGHRWLSTLDATFRGVELLDDEDAGIRQLALSDAVVRVIDLTVDATDTNDDWYPYAFDAVEWLFEARGLRLTPKVRSAMRQTMGVFTSWVGPTAEEARAAGDAVALAAVRTAFETRYPGGE
jgi:hypothetical protein